ncbi:ABC transporter permease [Oceanicaulis sp. MMSF_3324]|uniref:ABC transporter permease n=1 Tax=Oceanicaulis sp. MMSF_3324 TaxID=3046702 RepID=UPI00273D91E0|nr:ABC transporter permease [Oceanicaulis sp. MMSF_3324]
MIQLLRALLAESMKLNRSLVLLLAAAPPAMLGLMILMVILTGNSADRWDQMALSGAAIWAYLLMPLTVTALTALMAGIEHGCSGWTWSLAQPTPKVTVFLAKALVTLGVTALITLGVGVSILLAGHIALLIDGSIVMEGAPPYAMMAGLMAKMWLASLLMTAIQFTVAHAVSNFATPVIVGIGGVFVSVVATSSEYGVFFPWLLPVNMLASSPERAQQALLTGSAGGVLLFALASIWLARRDWR